MTDFSQILDAARRLTPSDQLRLAEALWDDVVPSDWPLPSQQWIAEARRRSKEHDKGRGSANSWADVRARARREAGLE
jgi:putative addiction module component (TIGR02574 family)